MRNRFNLNESEKNRIRRLHGINIINEQEDIDIKTDNKLTPEEYEALVYDADKQLKSINGKTVNFYFVKGAGQEGDPIAKFKIEDAGVEGNIGSGSLKKNDYKVRFVAQRLDEGGGNLVLGWTCGNFLFEVIENNLNEELNFNFGRMGKRVINDKLGDVMDGFCEKGGLNKLAHVHNKDFKVVDQADFASNDQAGGNVGMA